MKKLLLATVALSTLAGAAAADINFVNETTLYAYTYLDGQDRTHGDVTVFGNSHRRENTSRSWNTMTVAPSCGQCNETTFTDPGSTKLLTVTLREKSEFFGLHTKWYYTEYVESKL